MSGIAGVYHTDGRPAGEELDRMLGAMEHRGPDGTTAWRDGSVGLGHLMLETTPEDQYESLPLVDRSGNFAITADARIDNRDELIHKLDVRKPDDRPVTDTELILAAYKRWGRDCPKQLLGAFAFAVWDARERTLTLARDHFGLRPLSYVRQSGGFLAFASLEIALVRAGISTGKVNDRKVADFLLVPIQVEPEETYWEDMFSVPPAHTVSVTPEGTLTQRQYWELDPEKETKLESDEAYIERFRSIFEEAVRCRMRSSTPIASMLSGGLDSTSVACMAVQQLESGQQLHTLSAVFDSVPESNERGYQEAVLEMYDGTMVPTFFRADEAGPLRHLSWTTEHMGRPSGDGNGYIHSELYRRAERKGTRIVLGGFDGDTTVSHGHKYTNELLWSGRWIKLWDEVRHSVEFHGGDWTDQVRAIRGWVKHYLRESSLTKPLVEALRGTRGEGENGKLKIRDEGGGWTGDTWRQYIRDSLIEEIGPHIKEDEGRKKWAKERHYHHKILTRPLMEDILRGIDARASAAGVEARLPFYDVRLIEYCLSLPGHLKHRNGWPRWIQRSSMRGVLPRKVQWRKEKSNLSPSYRRGMKEHEGERLSSFKERMKEGESELVEYVERKNVANLASKIISEKEAGGEGTLFWRAVALDEWFSLQDSGEAARQGSQRVSYEGA